MDELIDEARRKEAFIAENMATALIAQAFARWQSEGSLDAYREWQMALTLTPKPSTDS